MCVCVCGWAFVCMCVHVFLRVHDVRVCTHVPHIVNILGFLLLVLHCISSFIFNSYIKLSIGHT